MSEQKTIATIAPFSAEADHPRNSDILLQSLNGVCDQRLRSRLKAAIRTVDKRGREHIRTPTVRGQSIPEISGMIIEVNPAKLEISIFDPLTENDAEREELARFYRQATGSRQNPQGVPRRDAKLDLHQMKTLCREILRLIEAGEMKLQSGSELCQEDCDEMPGHYLLNPGAKIQNNQPKFEKDLEAYKEKLLGAGG